MFRERLELTEGMAMLEILDPLDFPETEVTLDLLDLMGTKVLPETRVLLVLMALLATKVHEGLLE